MQGCALKGAARLTRVDELMNGWVHGWKDA